MRPNVRPAPKPWFGAPTLGLVQILGSMCAGLVLCGPAAATPRVSQVVLSTDRAPGAAVAFGSLQAPTVNTQGCIAFASSGTNALYSNAHGTRCGALARVVAAGKVPPGVLGPYSGFDLPALDDDGSIAFRGFAADTSVRGLYVYLGPGKLRLVADGSTKAPGTTETFEQTGPGFGIAYRNHTLLFSHTTPSKSGVYRALVAGTPTKISLSEVTSTNSGFVQFSDNAFSVSVTGDTVMELRRASDLTYGVYFANTRTDLKPVVQSGDRTTAGGILTGASTPSINKRGEIAFVGYLSDGKSGIFVKRGSGRPKLVVDSGSPVPGHPRTGFGGVSAPQLADDGSLVFIGYYRLPNPGYPSYPLGYFGIYINSGARISKLFDQFDGVNIAGQQVSLVERIFFPYPPRVLPIDFDLRYVTQVNGKTYAVFVQQLPGRRTGIFKVVGP